ncbi:MAG: hypothetical protein F4Y71_02010 [Acidobacteria bacterium]|nr:hypothetical protein [Acidobacteriota bacterium]MYG74682.1 hypothetical protein [Acidobacteriota bacterium]
MPVRPGGDSALSPEARDAVWRIFGAGAAPGARGSVFDNIEPTIRKHVPPADQDRAIATIGDWFESGAHVRWLKPDRAELVADLVIEGVGPRRSEDAVWAIGSVGLDLCAGRIKRRWAAGEIQTLVDAAVEVLNRTRARVRHEDRPAGQEDAELTSFQRAVSRDGIVAAFARLEEESLELVNQGLHPTVANLIDLAVELSPDEAPGVVSRLKLPTMQARAARRVVARTPADDPGAVAGWITAHSAEWAIALAIVHVLGAARKLDDSRAPRTDSSRAPARKQGFGEALEQPPDAVGNLVLRLLERLAGLEPADCLRWIGELLTQASRALSSSDGAQKSGLLAQLEDECTGLAVRLFCESGSPHLLAHFQSGLLPGRGRHWVRHQMAVARGIRESAPSRAEELARVTLDEHRRQLAEQRDGHYLAPDWASWKDREWLEGLGTALALARKDLDLRAWVADECRDLPLSVWDAEEDPDGFAMAEQMAQHWFLVALLAVPQRRAFSRPLEPPVVRALAEAVWAHCRFCRQHLQTHPEASVAAELAARYAMQYGRGNDQWLLDQARGEGVGPGALRVLLEHRRSSQPPVEGVSDLDDMIVAELVRIALGRFDDGGQFDLETLRDWGTLWLSLGAVDQAERTAMAIVSFPLRSTDRNSRILALKLLGLVVRHRKPRHGVAEYVVPLYNQLWPVFAGTPTQERKDREEIERAFVGSDLIPG